MPPSAEVRIRPGTAVLRILPPFAIRSAVWMHVRFSFLRGLLNLLLTGEGIIQRGEGKGLYFDARGCHPGYLAGIANPLEQSLVVRHAQPGGVVYNLGANAGFYALIAARAVGPRGRVYAFEPTPALAERIRRNAARNKLGNLEVVEAAVSDLDGEVAFGIRGPLSVYNSILAVDAPENRRVESRRIDTFCSDHPAPNLMLIDIEGTEIQALQGSLQTIRATRPVIMVEIHWQETSFADFFERSLAPLGYLASTYEGDSLPTGFIRYHALLLPSEPGSTDQKTWEFSCERARKP